MAARAFMALVALLLTSGFERPAPSPAAPSPFAGWAAVVVAADWRAGNGKPTAAFDNARRDISAALIRSGFRPENLRSYAVEPRESGVGETTGRNVFSGLAELAGRAPEGCLAYFTSHGSPGGLVFGRTGQLAPSVLARLLDSTCGDRPTVVMISACFSGVFVPALADPNRLVITAARRDRSSFGCGEDDIYPFFDGCVLESLPRSADFLVLGRTVRACVARREGELKLQPASEPQISVGARIRHLLPFLLLPGAAPAP